MEHKHAFQLVYLITKYFLKLFLVVTYVHFAWAALNAAKYRDIEILNNKIKGIRMRGKKSLKPLPHLQEYNQNLYI